MQIFPFFVPADDPSRAAGIELAEAVRNGQIVVGAISLGALSFLVIALFLQRENWGPVQAGRNPNPPVLTYVTLAMAAASIVAVGVVPGILVSAGRRQIVKQLPATRPIPLAESRPRLAALYLRKVIIAAALAEGAAFFAIVALLSEGQWVALVVAGVMIALVMWQFPSLASAERWIDDQVQRLAEEPVS